MIDEMPVGAPPKLGRNLPLLVFLPFIWALHFAFIKKIDANASPLGALTALLGGTSGLYFITLMVRKQMFAFTRERVIFFCVAGLFAYLLPLSAELVAAPHIDAGILTLIVSLTPVFTVAIAIMCFLIKPTLRLIMAALIGLVGVLLLFTQSTPSGSSPAIWILIACTVPLWYAIDALYVEYYWPKDLTALQIAFGESVLAFFAITLVLLASDESVSSAINWFTELDFIILCVVTTVEVVLFFYLVGAVGAVMVNIASYLLLPAGFFWGWMMFDESLTLVGFAGSVCAICALLLAGNGGERIQKTPTQ